MVPQNRFDEPAFMARLNALIETLRQMEPLLQVRRLEETPKMGGDTLVWFFTRPGCPFEVQVDPPINGLFMIGTDEQGSCEEPATMAEAVEIMTAFLHLSDPRKPEADPPRPDAVAAYIAAHWDATVRDGRANTDPNIAPPPMPHTVPCIDGHFVALFYWDLYFTNLGLLRQGRRDMARSNCDALLHLLREKGFVPNSTFRGDDTRSQPPFLSLMMRDLAVSGQGADWLAAATDALAIEHRFWTERRGTPTGLNRHGHQADDAYLRTFYDGLLVRRLGLDPGAPDAEKLRVSAHYLAEAETGEDFTPRYEGRCLDFAPVSLNSLLFAMERNLVEFSSGLGRRDEATIWAARAAERRARMDALLWDESAGIYREYDFVHARQATLAGVTTFYPLFVGAASPEQAARVRASLPRFEREHGVAHNEPRQAADGPEYQWDYPNGWPPMFWIVAQGLSRYGFHDDARRIAGKYRVLITRHFERTGQIWEKYDVTTGGLAGGEYAAQPMLGWTAGVYLACGELLAR